MASLVARKNGAYWIQVKVGSVRKTIRLEQGTDRRGAEEIRRRVESLNACRLAGMTPDEATATWIGRIDRKLHRRLAAAGLIADRPAYTLVEFLEYVFARLNVKESTKTSYANVKRNLLDYFGPAKAISTITAGDAEEFSAWLATNNEVRRDKVMSKATVAGRTRRARQFFTVAIKKKWITENPFAEIKVGSQTNESRMHYVPMEHIEALMKELPNDEYRAIVALARIAAFRVPSEPLSLQWQHINWETGMMSVYAPKTGFRPTPIFASLRPYLEALWDQAETGSPWVISKHRITGQAMSSIVLRAIGRAGIPIWPKLFQNLRSSAETDMMARFPLHVCCKWCGNSPKVAQRHYLQVTPQHIADATGMRSTDHCESAARRSAG